MSKGKNSAANLFVTPTATLTFMQRFKLMVNGVKGRRRDERVCSAKTTLLINEQLFLVYKFIVQMTPENHRELEEWLRSKYNLRKYSKSNLAYTIFQKVVGLSDSVASKRARIIDAALNVNMRATEVRAFIQIYGGGSFSKAYDRACEMLKSNDNTHEESKRRSARIGAKRMPSLRKPKIKWADGVLEVFRGAGKKSIKVTLSGEYNPKTGALDLVEVKRRR